jgi:hypothetical protein
VRGLAKPKCVTSASSGKSRESSRQPDRKSRILARHLKGCPWWRLRWLSGLRFFRSRGDCPCPLHSPTCRSDVYPPWTGGLRSLLVADAFGAPVLRDQGTDRPAGHGKADPSLDPLHAMQFPPPLLPQVRSSKLGQPASTSDRGCPLDTARVRCLWHTDGTAGESDDVPT